MSLQKKKKFEFLIKNIVNFIFNFEKFSKATIAILGKREQRSQRLHNVNEQTNGGKTRTTNRQLGQK